MTEQLTGFVEALKTPGLSERFTSAETLETVLRLGTAREQSVTDEAIAGTVEPFATDADRTLGRRCEFRV